MARSDVNDLNIRRASDRDLDALAAMMVAFRDYLEQTFPSEAVFREALVQLLADPATDFLIATIQSQAVGYAQCRYRYSAWVGGPEVEIEDLWVAPQARRRAVGSRLLTEVSSRAAARQCRALALTTNEGNRPALELYTRFGFASERPRWQGGRQLWLQRLMADGDGELTSKAK